MAIALAINSIRRAAVNSHKKNVLAQKEESNILNGIGASTEKSISNDCGGSKMGRSATQRKSSSGKRNDINQGLSNAMNNINVERVRDLIKGKKIDNTTLQTALSQAQEKLETAKGKANGNQEPYNKEKIKEQIKRLKEIIKLLEAKIKEQTPDQPRRDSTTEVKENTDTTPKATDNLQTQPSNVQEHKEGAGRNTGSPLTQNESSSSKGEQSPPSPSSTNEGNTTVSDTKDVPTTVKAIEQGSGNGGQLSNSGVDDKTPPVTVTAEVEGTKASVDAVVTTSTEGGSTADESNQQGSPQNPVDDSSLEGKDRQSDGNVTGTVAPSVGDNADASSQSDAGANSNDEEEQTPNQPQEISITEVRKDNEESPNSVTGSQLTQNEGSSSKDEQSPPSPSSTNGGEGNSTSLNISNVTITKDVNADTVNKADVVAKVDSNVATGSENTPSVQLDAPENVGEEQFVQGNFGYTIPQGVPTVDTVARTENAKLSALTLRTQRIILEAPNGSYGKCATGLSFKFGVDISMIAQKFLNAGISGTTFSSSTGHAYTIYWSKFSKASPGAHREEAKILMDLVTKGAFNGRIITVTHSPTVKALEQGSGNGGQPSDPEPTPNPILTPTPGPIPALKPVLPAANKKPEQVDANSNCRQPNNGSIQSVQKSKLPVVATWTLAGAAAPAAYFAFSVSLLATGIIAGIGACCLVAATIIYCCRPKSSVENSKVESFERRTVASV